MFLFIIFNSSSHVGVTKSKKEKTSIFNFLNAPIESTAGLQAQPSSSAIISPKETEKSTPIEDSPNTLIFDDKIHGFDVSSLSEIDNTKVALHLLFLKDF